MNFAQHFQDGQKVACNLRNWKEPHFSWDKAYVASVLSRSAYEYIPEYGLKMQSVRN